MKTKMICMAMLAVLFLTSAASAFEIATEDAYPILGEKTKVTLEGGELPDKATLTVTYRPNSATSHETTVGTFNAGHSIVWKPESPGITTLIVKDAGGKKLASKNVAVCFPSAPASGIAIMLLAGTVLFGGAAYSLRNALR